MLTQSVISLLKKQVEAVGGTFFEEGDYNLNLIFERSSQRFTDLDDDTLYVAYRRLGLWEVVALRCSTKAGVFEGKDSLFNPVTVDGITGMATIVAGKQYAGVYKLADSKVNWLKYPYFHQIGALAVYRDNTHDLTIDTDVPVQKGLFQIHIHRRGPVGLFNRFTDNYSIGCITLDTRYLDILVHLARQQIQAGHGNRFSFTLLQAKPK
ncbi:MAG: hypothetical protein AAF734_07205 [Bacteroidota bacterium]